MTTRAQYIAAATAYAGRQAGRFNRTWFSNWMTRFLAGQPTIEDTSVILYQLLGADMTLTTDQVLTVRPGLRAFTNYVITEIFVVRASGAFGTACAGGIYDTAAKAGNAWVAAGQSYAALTGAKKIVKPTLGAIAGTEYAVSAPILALTTGNTGALTADIYVRGVIVD